MYYILPNAPVKFGALSLAHISVSHTFTLMYCICIALNAAQQLDAISLSLRVNARKHGNSQQAF